MTVSVILLAHNEAQTIQEEIRAFHEAVLRHLPGAELIVAEDGSGDGTRGRIVEIAREIPLRLVGEEERLGYSRAVLNAIGSSTKPWIFLCDAGLKHEPRDFWSLWRVREDYDLVVGRKTDRQDHLHRRVITFVFNFILRQLFDVEVFDADCGMRLLSRRAVDEVVNGRLTFKGFVSTEIVLRAIAAGLRYGEVPIAYRMRAGDSRALPLRKIPAAARGVLADIIRLRRELRP
jgi:glycosyltransferase involved in cell wall biosynthesis